MYVVEFHQTPTPQVSKPAPKTPLVQTALVPDLSAFLTPRTPSLSVASPSTEKYRYIDRKSSIKAMC